MTVVPGLTHTQVHLLQTLQLHTTASATAGVLQVSLQEVSAQLQTIRRQLKLSSTAAAMASITPNPGPALAL